MADKKVIEGEIFDIINVEDKSFEIKYGYYEEYEREYGEPVPLFPDMAENPEYTKDGYRIVTKMQDPCKQFEFKTENFSEEWCGSCSYYKDEKSLISVCTNNKNKEAY